ncbi:MAG: FapA family protein [Planctomycetota bacterium]
MGNDSAVLRITVEVSKDGLQAWIRPTAPDDPRPLSREDVLAALEDADIVLNDSVNEKIEAFLSPPEDPEDRPDRFLVAQGKPPIEGTDDEFIAMKDVDSSESEDGEEENDDGRIDFHAFSMIVTVEVDEPVGKVTKAVPGTPGCDVHGKAIEPKRTVRRVELDSTVRRTGEDPSLILANTAGKVVYENNSVRIVEIVKVNGDVDYESGNVKSSTDVIITGTILDEFEVSSKQGVFVSGAIQAAKVEAEGDVLVKGGVISRHKGAVRAGGQIALKFASEAMLTSGGDVSVTRELMNCQVHCEGVCRVVRGDVIGGEVYAKVGLEACAIGSRAAVPTSIIVGIHPSVLAKVNNATERNRLDLTGAAQGCQAPYVLVSKVVYPGSRIRIGRKHVVFAHELKGPVRIEKRKVKSVTEFVAVSQASGSITVLKSIEVVDDEGGGSGPH